MPLLLTRSAFLHIPKTGGTWVRDAILRSGVPVRDLGHYHDHPAAVHRQDVLRTYRAFGFVRHPCAWLRSFWCWAMGTDWRHAKEIGTYCRADTFPQFIENVLTVYPDGVAGTLFRLYLGAQAEHVAYIGRQERLLHDLVIILCRCAEPARLDLLRTTPERNVFARSAVWRAQSQYPRSLWDALCRAEASALETYGYSDAFACIDEPGGGVLENASHQKVIKMHTSLARTPRISVVS